MPPPPPVVARAAQHKVPFVATLIPLAGALAVIGVFTPWFKPSGSYQGRPALEAKSALYSWEDGKIGLIAPILLALVGIGVLGLFMGRNVSRFAGHTDGPVIAASKSALVAGGISGAALAIAWFLVPGQFDKIPTDAGGDWDGAEKLGIEMTRGPQLGFWCTVAAAALALVGGLLTQIMHRPPPPAPGAGYGPPPAWAPPVAPPAYGSPAYGSPAYGPPAYGSPAAGQPLVYTPPPMTAQPNWQSPAPARQQPSQDWQPLVYRPPARNEQPPS